MVRIAPLKGAIDIIAFIEYIEKRGCIINVVVLGEILIPSLYCFLQKKIEHKGNLE